MVQIARGAVNVEVLRGIVSWRLVERNAMTIPCVAPHGIALFAAFLLLARAIRSSPLSLHLPRSRDWTVMPGHTAVATNFKEFAMLRRLFTLLVLTGVVAALPAGAMQFTNPQAEYSADRVMQTESATFEQHVYYTPTKERTEMQASGKNSEQMPIQILRKDTKVMWQLMPSQKMYMEYSLDRPAPNTMKKDPADMTKWDFDETVVGEEVMEGVNVTKYKTIATSADGKKFGGFSWRTKEGIQVKLDLLYKEGEEKHRMTTELRNLKIGPQDPQLFEVPPGYTKLDMAGMMGGMRAGKGMSSTERRDRVPVNPSDTENPSNAASDPDDKSDVDKAKDMMKKLFGR
jgi:outer membrane lipoprotein-sorting protein